MPDLPPVCSIQYMQRGVHTMTFKELNIIEPILKALTEEGYSTPTPIQQEAIPIVLGGNDILGCAQTGTGKTAAFSIPIIQLLEAKGSGSGRSRAIKALILTPTRELAIQIGESFASYGRHTKLRHVVIFGGVGQKPQTDALRAGVDILIATPGRLLDLIGQGYVNLKTLDFFVLDEADRMLDMGFIHDIKRILPLIPQKRQTLFFSATMPQAIASLADSILTNPVRVEVTPVSSTVDMIDQYLYFAEKDQKRDLLIDLLKDPSKESVLVFSRTKHGADKIAKLLCKAGIGSEAIHGNKSQNARQRALSNFKNRTTRVLIATDIAARGIDVDQLSHVINYDLPDVPETYVHRIGRTGRAGCSGVAITFCDLEEVPMLRDIQKLIGKTINVVDGHDFETPESQQAKVSAMIGGRGASPASSRQGGAQRSNRSSGSNHRGGGSSRPAARRVDNSEQGVDRSRSGGSGSARGPRRRQGDR